jgi:hypothetical protein
VERGRLLRLNGHLNEDLNFLFSETPEIPAPSNDAADPMAITSQLPANPFEPDMEYSPVLKSTNLAKLPNSNIGDHPRDSVLLVEYCANCSPNRHE